jgi:tetratricopeptide (TPR) repeat protein
VNYRMRFTWISVVALLIVTWSACNSTHNVAASSPDNGKIPITTKSAEARSEFLQGRDLSDRLLAQDSWAHLQKAVTLDPEFASAEMALATSSPTAGEFLDHMNKAVRLADKASEGEKLTILAAQAGVNNDVVKQKDYLEKVAAAFPNDERAQFNLGNYYFGQQEYPQAIEYDKKATEIAPNYSPAYNILGYSYKQTGDYANAEQAFQKYIQLIPNDPNPYDSYAELLLRMGKYDESITQYRKALSLDPNFSSSRFGLSGDLTYLGKTGEAEAELQTMAARARNDGERRTAFFGLAVLASDAGNFQKAEQAMDLEYAVAEKKSDVLSMAADLQAKGNIAGAAQKYDDAKQYFERSQQIMQDSNLAQEIKDVATLQYHYDLSTIAAGKKDFALAKTEQEEFRKGADASNNPVQVKQAHELAGIVALAQKDFDTAIAELQQANQLNPQNLYRLGQAYQAKGDTAKAHEYFGQAASFNSLPQLPYAFIRVKAQKMAGGKPA